MNATQVFRHDYISYFVSVPPVAVDYNDPVWRERINAYYVASVLLACALPRVASQ